MAARAFGQRDQRRSLLSATSRGRVRNITARSHVCWMCGPFIKIGGKDKINLGTFNFLGLVGNEEIKVRVLRPAEFSFRTERRY